MLVMAWLVCMSIFKQSDNANKNFDCKTSQVWENEKSLAIFLIVRIPSYRASMPDFFTIVDKTKRKRKLLLSKTVIFKNKFGHFFSKKNKINKIDRSK